MQEADELISRLRGLAAVVAEPTFTLMARMGRWDSHLSRRECYEMSGRIEAELERSGIPRKDIDRARSELDRTNGLDMARPILQGILRHIAQESDARRQAMHAFPQPIVDLEAHGAAVTAWREAEDAVPAFSRLFSAPSLAALPQTLLDSLAACPVLSEEDRTALRNQYSEEIADLQHYAQHRQFRRLTAWLDGG